MAIGRIRVALIIILFVGSTTVPVLMETSIVPMINLLNFVQDFVEVQNDELVVHYDKLLNSIKRIECLTDESSENQTVIQITINVTNNDPYWFDMLIPGIDMTVYWKAGLPYELEKQTVLGWVESDVNNPNWKKEPNYYQDGNGRRWTRVLGIKINPLRIHPQEEKDLQIKIYLYNDEWDRGKSNALGQMIGTILRTKSTKDLYTNETLMHISGTASLDVPLSFPLSLDVGLDLSSFLNLTELLGGLGEPAGAGAGNGEEQPNLFDLLFDVPLNIFDIQNYNDSNGNFKRDYSGIDNETNMKIWTEDLYQHGAISAYVFMDLKDQLGMKSLNITLLQSSYNPDDADVNKTWHPEIAGSPIPKETVTNQLFLYIPESNSLHNPDWGNKIFGLLGFTSDQRLIDYPTQAGDFGDGNIIAGGTLRLTGDLRENASFSVGDGLGALITQAVEGILPIGIFGSIDLKFNDMPLSICLDLPLEVNLTSLLSDLMGGEEEEGGGGDIFSMLMDYMGLKTILLNGIAFDTWDSILQLNFSADLDMFLPYGIYMPSDVTYDENGEAVPYLGIAGGPIQIFDESIPDDLNGQRFAVEYTETPTIINGTALQLSRGNVTEIVRIFNGTSIYNITHEWWDDAHPIKYFSTNPVSTTIYVDTSATGDPFTQANFTAIKVIYKSAVWKTDWYNEHLIMNISSLDSPTLKESLAKLMATIGKTDQGEGVAYTFDDDENPLTHHGDLQKFLRDNGELPNADDHKSSFQLTEDQFKLDLTDIVPDFGKGLLNVIEGLGIDPLFIEYINNSIPHDNSKNVIQDLLSIRQMLNILSQDGPKNDLFDYLLDSNLTRNETVTVIDGQTLQVSHWGLKYITNIYNSTYYWCQDGVCKYPFNLWDNGTIRIETTINDLFNESGPIQVEYITSKLELLDVSNLIGAVLNLTMGTGDGTEGGGISQEMLSEIIRYLPGTLDAMGIDFDRIMPDLISYLRLDISHPEPEGYGIKPFEMLDVAFSAMGGNGDGGDSNPLGSLLGGLSSEFIDNLMENVVYKFIEQADPFQLLHATMGDLTPLLDYLDRSKIFSREVLIPLIASLFPSGSELEGVGEETFALDKLIEIAMPLISEILVSGDDAHFPHGALNPFAFLTAPECIINYGDINLDHYNQLINKKYSIYEVGMNNYTPDYPPYDYLRLWSNVTLGLVMSGFKASDLWNLIDMMGIFGGEEEGTSDPFAGFDSLVKLLGAFCPPTEWLSIFREIGIWSTWSGEMSLVVGPILGFLGPWEFGPALGSVLNLEKFLAIGYAQGLFGLLNDWLFGFPFGIMENQSYGLPFTYVPGYDSSHNTGPYRDVLTQDNWGWVPLGWDPGGLWPHGWHSAGDPYKDAEGNYIPPIPGGSGYGDPANNYIPYGGTDYPKSTITRLAAALPLEFDVYLPDFVFELSLLGIPISMFLALQLFLYLRLEGNPSMLVQVFEDEGTPLLGLAGHFVGGDLAGLVTDMIGSLTSPSATSNETTQFPELDLVALLQGFLNADVEILHYWKFLVDPEFMKGSEWYLDSSYVNALGNTSNPTLLWDQFSGLGDNDGIPDEFPWYRFSIPIYNQDPALVNVGPGYTPDSASRTPPLIDYLTPDGPPGSGIWAMRPDGIPDGLQHYWYDTPYAYINTTVSLEDPWLWVDPYQWNDPGNFDGGKKWRFDIDPGPGTNYKEWPAPLMRTAEGADGVKTISDSAWDATNIPSLYYVNTGEFPGVPGSIQPSGAWEIPGLLPLPNIWNCFNVTLNQTDYRFGFWDNSETTLNTYWDKDTLNTTCDFLNIKPFYDLLSYAFYPQLRDILDMVDIASLFETTGAAPSLGSLTTSLGVDYYHLIRYDDVYSKFGIEQVQPLNPLAMLQWLWDGAGKRFNGSQMVPYIEPYTVPNLQGALDWLAEHGFTIDFIITNLGKITDLLATEVGSSGGASDVFSQMFSADSIVGMINAIEEYMIRIVAQNNQTKAAQIALNIMKDMVNLLDIYPVKAIRGALNYLMPRLSEGGEGGAGSLTDVNQLDIGTFLEQSGLLDIIFENISKMNDLKFTVSIHNSLIDLYLFGQKIEDVPLDIEFELDLTTLFGSEEESGTGTGSEGAPTDFMNQLPIAFPEGGLPYIELSTFQGPFEVTFHLYNTSRTGGIDPVINTNVTIGEIWYNETTGVYYLNRTQSGFEATYGISGWTDQDAQGNYRTYVRPNSALQSNASGYVTYSSVIEQDTFGWVDPYIYIHVEEPAMYPSNTFYWWNVTGHPYQRTLAGNKPAYKARWIEDGRQILVQSENTLPADCIQIDGDSYWEIFARVEIDGTHMPIQDVVYIEAGSVSNIVVANNSGPPMSYTQVEINASYQEIDQQWRIAQTVDRTTYTFEEEITPSGRAVTYPTISEVISGFHLRTNNWNDDSLYQVRIYYLNLTGDFHTLYSFDLPSQEISGVYTYGGSNNPPIWLLTGSPSAYLTFNFSPMFPAEHYGQYRYAKLDVDASNFVNKTIQWVSITINVTNSPNEGGPAYWVTQYLYNDFSYSVPGYITYFFHQDTSGTSLNIRGYNSTGAAPLEEMQAEWAWFNYTVPIDSLSFLNEIKWNVSALEDGDGRVTNIYITYFNETDQQNYVLQNDVLNSPTAEGSLTDWGLLSSIPDDPWSDLYLTRRGASPIENVSSVTFAVRINESDTSSYSGIGYTNGQKIYNTSVMVQFIFYPFITKWGIEGLGDDIEIPEGFFSDFDIRIRMYDPLLGIASISPGDFPQVNVTYYRMGPLVTSLSIDNESFFAEKVIVHLEAWDSLVRLGGIRGDIFYKDNQTSGTTRLVPLSNQPTLNTTIEVVDLEARVYINVSIGADQTLRNYYLYMGISPAMGYAQRGYTSNYRLSVISNNPEAVKRIGAYASKKVLNTSPSGFPSQIQIGKVDLEAYPVPYLIQYILTFDVSPEFVINNAVETFYFKAVWEKAVGTYEVRSDKQETSQESIQIIYT